MPLIIEFLKPFNFCALSRIWRAIKPLYEKLLHSLGEE